MSDDREAIIPLIPFPQTKDTPRPRGGLLVGPVGVLPYEPDPPPNVLPPAVCGLPVRFSPMLPPNVIVHLQIPERMPVDFAWLRTKDDLFRKLR